jgi:hypothetical protein
MTIDELLTDARKRLPRLQLLHALGLYQATDVIGGFQAGRAASLPFSSPDNGRTARHRPGPRRAGRNRHPGRAETRTKEASS